MQEESGPIRSAAGFLDRVEHVCVAVAAVLMLAVMLIVVADVFCRYVLNSPFSWAYDLIGLYLMAAIFFLVLSPAYAHRAHIGLDIIHKMMPKRLRLAADLVTNVVGMALFLAIAKIGFDRFLGAFQSGDVIAGSIAWPTWASYVLVPIGAGLLAVRMFLHALAGAVSLATRTRFAFLEDDHRDELERAG